MDIKHSLSTVQNWLSTLIGKLQGSSLTPEEIQLISETRLFDKLSESQLKTLLKKITKISLKKDEIVVKEGELGNALYIILEGSVRIFTEQANEKIALARLEKGAYFGEQAIYSQTHKTRSASAETITEVTLVKIDAEDIVPYWNASQHTLEKLKKIGYQQMLNTISTVVGSYENILNHLQNIEGAFVKEIDPNKIIFSAGDKSNYVYLILQGNVELLIPEKTSKRTVSCIIGRGQIFGELSVITNKSRNTTAVSQDNLKLLCIKGNLFQQAIKDLPPLQHLLANQKNIYQVAAYGINSQYVGKIRGIDMFTSVYKMENGRNIVATQSIQGSLFTMKVSDQKSTETSTYKNGSKHIKLGIHQDALLEIEVEGEWEDLPTACGLIINNQPIYPDMIKHFKTSGSFFETRPEVTANPSDNICLCMLVNRGTIQAKIDSGVNTLDQISRETGACTVCKGCKFKILEMLGASPWRPATLKPAARHNENIRSFAVQSPSDLTTSFSPGQYIVIQTKMNQLWIERAYTISEVKDEHALHITIKKEPMGVFSNWLFDNVSDAGINIDVTVPQGDFTLPATNNIPVICFAGGVGITPFIAFAKHANYHGKMYILYCALTEKDFIFVDEFNAMAQSNPLLSIRYRATDKEGLLSSSEIIGILKEFSHEDIYICGPEGFENTISKVLNDMHYDKNKIHVEKFLHAGQNPASKTPE